jgi:hypothetical protein
MIDRRTTMSTIETIASAADQRPVADAELDAVSGGVFPYYAAVHRWMRPADLVSLNPQPLPPGGKLSSHSVPSASEVQALI